MVALGAAGRDVTMHRVMRTTHVIGVAVLAVWTGVGLAAAQEAKQLTIRRRSGPMWPWQDLRQRGLPVADLPEAAQK